MKYYKKIVGENIYLSPISIKDVAQYTEWMNDPIITTNIGNKHKVFSYLNEEKHVMEMSTTGCNLAIVSLKDDRLLGNIGFFDINQLHQRAEIGIFIGDKNQRGKGIGTEALRLMLEYGFETLNLNSVYLKTSAINTAGIRCYQKVGFKQVGIQRQCHFSSGSFQDDMMMDILRSEFDSKI